MPGMRLAAFVLLCLDTLPLFVSGTCERGPYQDYQRPLALFLQTFNRLFNFLIRWL